MKNKKVFLLAVVIAGGSLFFGLSKVFAAADDAACKSFNANFNCVDITTLSVTNTCIKNKCLGQYAKMPNVQCCPSDAPLKNMAGNIVTGAATASSSSVTCDPNDKTKFCNPLGFTNVEGLLSGIMSAIQKIVIVLAVVFILIGSVMILASAGSSDMVENGKKAITAALVGVALAIAAPALLKELGTLVGWIPDCAVGDLACESVKKALTLTQIAKNVLDFLLGTMGIVALVMMVIGASMYLTSAGDEDRIDKGKEIFKYSLIGVIMAMSAMILLTQIAKFFI